MTLSRRSRSGSPAKRSGGVGGGAACRLLASFRFNSVRTRRSPSARCASRHRFLRWRRTQTSICGLRRISPSRRLSLDLPASLETPKVEASRSLSSLDPVPKPRGLAGRAALHLGYNCHLWPRCQAALPATLICVSNGRRSRFYGHQVSHQFSG